MSDFMNAPEYRPLTIEQLAADRDALHSALTDVLRQRDDARLEADRLKGEVARLAKERDDVTGALFQAKLEGADRADRASFWKSEADRLEGEVARLAKERDAAWDAASRHLLDAEALRQQRDVTIADLRKLRAFGESAEPLKPCRDDAKTIERLERIAGILGKPANGVPGDAEVRLAQVGMIVGRMLGELKS